MPNDFKQIYLVTDANDVINIPNRFIQSLSFDKYTQVYKKMPNWLAPKRIETFEQVYIVIDHSINNNVTVQPSIFANIVNEESKGKFNIISAANTTDIRQIGFEYDDYVELYYVPYADNRFGENKYALNLLNRKNDLLLTFDDGSDDIWTKKLKKIRKEFSNGLKIAD